MEYVLRRGVVVRAFTIADVEEIYTIRNALEMLTLPAIIEKATDEDIASMRAQLREMDDLIAAKDYESLSPVTRAFHRQMTNLCGQNRILRVIEGQDEFITRFSAMAMTGGERKTIHGNNERIRLDCAHRAVEFYIRLMKKC